MNQNRITFRSAFAMAIAAMIIITGDSVLAANGTWTQTGTGGTWSDTGNWSGGTVAGGSGSTADFSTIDITADNTVHLDTSRTISGLTFGDTDTGTAAGWVLDDNGNPANVLTLGSAPTITVNDLGAGKSVEISAGIAGTAGLTLTKEGDGTLTLSGGGNLGGILQVNGGTVTIADGTLASRWFFADNGGHILVTGGVWTVTCNNTIPTIGSKNVAGATAHYTQTGGSVALTSVSPLLRTSEQAIQKGDLTFSGGTFSAGWIVIGMRGDSTATISDAALVSLSVAFDFGHSKYIGDPGARVLNLGDGVNFDGGSSINDGGTSGILATPIVRRRVWWRNPVATFNFNGGTLRATADSADYMLDLVVVSVQDSGGIIDNDGHAITITKPLLHGGVADTDGGLVFKGAGTTTLGGVNTYTGPTTIEAGTLAMAVGSDLHDDTAVVIKTGAKLQLDENITVYSLTFDSKGQLGGTWGAVGSGATHEDAFFDGAGILTVIYSEPIRGTVIIVQ